MTNKKIISKNCKVEIYLAFFCSKTGENADVLISSFLRFQKENKVV